MIAWQLMLGNSDDTLDHQKNFRKPHNNIDWIRLELAQTFAWIGGYILMINIW